MPLDRDKAIARIRQAQTNLDALEDLQYMAGLNHADYVSRLQNLRRLLVDAENALGTPMESYELQRCYAGFREARRAIDDLVGVNPQETQIVKSLYDRLDASKTNLRLALEAVGIYPDDVAG